MNHDKKSSEGIKSADDNVDHNIAYDKAGKLLRRDDRDKNNSSEDWNAEASRTGRHR